MAYTFEEIVGIVRMRQSSQSDLLDRMNEIKDRYNGDYVIPLPSMDDEPILPPLTPALISENIDAPNKEVDSKEDKKKITNDKSDNLDGEDIPF